MQWDKLATGDRWSWVCHLDYGDRGTVTVVRGQKGAAEAKPIESGPASGLDEARRPILLGLNDDDQVILMDPASHALSVQAQCPPDARYAYAYRDPASERVWFMNDGDKDGNDPLHCGGQGSSVTIVEAGATPRVVKTLCVGRGHHVTTFVGPTDGDPDLPRRAFVSNLKDGTVSVVGNDPDDGETFLQVLDTINLWEGEKEEGGEAVVPNQAFPHGMMFSPVTGKVYNLNNGYATIAVIDPRSHGIEKRISLPVSSNLLLSPDGRFLIGKGADRKADAQHVMGRLSVVDTVKGEVVNTLDLKDVYPSTYRFSPDGSKLYVTTATTGKGAQRDNLDNQSLFIYDATRLPALELEGEVKTGPADCGRRPIGFVGSAAGVDLVFVPNPTEGTVSIVDANHEVVDTLTVGEGGIEEFSFSFWDGRISAC